MNRLNLCVIGNMLGRNPGYVTTQGQILGDLLASEGYSVASSSSRLNRMLRLVEIIGTVIRNRKKTDILIVEVYSGLNFFVAWIVGHLAHFFSLPTIFVLHGGNLPELVRRRPRWTARVLGRADKLIAPSKYLARELHALEIPISVIPNVIDLSNYSFEKRRSLKPKLLWMRAFHEMYNPQMAVRVLESLRKKYPGASLVMAGVDKGLEPKIRRMVEEIGLGEAVRFPGFLDQEAKVREFSNADIFLNTNLIDNMPVAVIEACAAGLPVAATCVGGIPDLLQNGQTGLLVPSDDVDGMVMAVESLLKDPELAERISLNGRRLAEESSWEKVRIQWEELFREMQLGEKKQRLVGLPVGKVANQ